VRFDKLRPKIGDDFELSVVKPLGSVENTIDPVSETFEFPALL
jgi:hypothetical protein